MRNIFVKLTFLLVLSTAFVACNKRSDTVVYDKSVYKGVAQVDLDDQETDTAVASTNDNIDWDQLYSPFQPSEYLFSKGDRLEVEIMGQADTRVESLPVAPDGKLYYLFLDGIQVENRTIDEVATEMEQKLTKLFAKPEVSIVPRERKGHKYVMMGLVNQPGAYYLDAPLSLRDAISRANGLAMDNDGTISSLVSFQDSFLVRDGKKIPLSKTDFLAEESAPNLYLRPGDYVYIASNAKNYVYRIGAVEVAAELIHRDGMTLLGSLSSGLQKSAPLSLPRAYLEGVLLIRGELHNPEVHQIDVTQIIQGNTPDIYLLPGDIVYVPFKRYKFQSEETAQAISLFDSQFMQNRMR